MLNGRYDALRPLETSQRPMFELLGTPAEHKRHVVFEGGHFVPRHQLIQETVDWLDRYLGPVSQVTRQREKRSKKDLTRFAQQFRKAMDR